MEPLKPQIPQEHDQPVDADKPKAIKSLSLSTQEEGRSDLSAHELVEIKRGESRSTSPTHEIVDDVATAIKPDLLEAMRPIMDQLSRSYINRAKRSALKDKLMTLLAKETARLPIEDLSMFIGHLQERLCADYPSFSSESTDFFANFECFATADTKSPVTEIPTPAIEEETLSMAKYGIERGVEPLTATNALSIEADILRSQENHFINGELFKSLEKGKYQNFMKRLAKVFGDRSEAVACYASQGIFANAYIHCFGNFKSGEKELLPQPTRECYFIEKKNGNFVLTGLMLISYKAPPDTLGFTVEKFTLAIPVNELPTNDALKTARDSIAKEGEELKKALNESLGAQVASETQFSKERIGGFYRNLFEADQVFYQAAPPNDFFPSTAQK